MGSSMTFANVRAGTALDIRYCTMNNPGKLGLYVNGRACHGRDVPEHDELERAPTHDVTANARSRMGASVKLPIRRGRSGREHRLHPGEMNSSTPGPSRQFVPARHARAPHRAAARGRISACPLRFRRLMYLIWPSSRPAGLRTAPRGARRAARERAQRRRPLPRAGRGEAGRPRSSTTASRTSSRRCSTA
jgi:hypothetical protein